jgi:citrate synthase
MLTKDQSILNQHVNMSTKRQQKAAGRSTSLMDAASATKALKISRASLYVYVSRGLIRSTPDPANGKSSLYAAADIQTLIARKKQSRRPRAAAAAALDYGLPVLKTRITHFEGNHCFYRGRDAVALSRKATLEEAARLLWDSGEHDPFPEVRFDPRRVTGWAATAKVSATDRATDRAMMLLSLLTPHEVTPSGKPGPHAFQAAANLLAAVTVSIVGTATAYAGPVHRVVASAWRRPKAAEIIRRALVLLADHELNASTFAVRVVASTGAGLTHCTIAGLAAMSGPRHGGATERLRALLDEIDACADAEGVIEARLNRGETIPGFGNSVYPDADPRGAELMAGVKLDRTMAAALQAARELAGGEPNVDFGLLAIERTFDLPRGAALALFALGRSVGWIAHAFEQRAAGTLIRPRAEFVLE